MDSLATIQNIWPLFRQRAYSDLFTLFGGFIDIDVPIYGRITNNDIFRLYADHANDWLDAHRVEHRTLGLCENSDRVVYESYAYHTYDNVILDIPLAIVFERTKDNPALIRTARVYHPTLNIKGQKTLRRALLNPDPSIRFSGSKAQYFTALAKGDKNAFGGVFTDDVQMGIGHHITTGPDKVADAFETMFTLEGHVVLQYNTVTENNEKTCLEFTCDMKGVHLKTPQAGLAVYGKGPDGKISYVRIYEEPITDHRIW